MKKFRLLYLRIHRWIMRLFGRDEMSLGRVHGSLVIKEGFDKLTLYVDADAMRLTAALMQENERLRRYGEKATAKQQKELALDFAATMFGREQAQKLLDFYHGNAACVISVCAQYFSGTLTKLIAKAQKRLDEVISTPAGNADR